MDLKNVILLTVSFGGILALDSDEKDSENGGAQLHLLAGRLFFLSSKLDSLERSIEMKVERVINQLEDFTKREKSSTKLDETTLHTLKQHIHDLVEPSVAKHVTVMHRAILSEKRVMHKLRNDIKTETNNLKLQVNATLETINDAYNTHVSNFPKIFFKENIIYNISGFFDMLKKDNIDLKTELNTSLETVISIYETNMLNLRTEQELFKGQIVLALIDVNEKMKTVNEALVNETNRVLNVYKQLIESNNADISSLSDQTSLIAKEILSFSGQVSSSMSSLSDRISSLFSLRSKFSTFYAWLSEKKTGHGKFTRIVFDAVLVNRGGDYSPSTGIYTAPTDGYYLFQFSVMCTNETCCVMLTEDSNYRVKAVSYEDDIGVGNTGILHLNKGAKLWVQSVGCEFDMESDATSFSGALLYALYIS